MLSVRSDDNHSMVRESSALEFSIVGTGLHTVLFKHVHSVRSAKMSKSSVENKKTEGVAGEQRVLVNPCCVTAEVKHCLEIRTGGAPIARFGGADH